MKTAFASLSAILVLTLFSASSAWCADQKSTVNSYDSKFIKEAAAGGETEVKLSTLASKKAERSDVKEFAQLMIKDHTAANDELKALAEKKGVELSAVVPPKTAEIFQSLEKQSGKDFDNAYLKQMEADHKKTVSMFEEASKKAEDADLKAFINKTLPTLKGHYDKVKSLRSK